MLDRKEMSSIEARFEERGKGLAMDEFVAVMLEHLDFDPSNKRRKVQITLALIDFFKEVDVNGDRTMEWEEFSNHIIELGLLREDRSFKNVVKSYFPTDSLVDTEKHESGIDTIRYFEKLKEFFLIEKESPRFQVYSAASGHLLYEVHAQKGSVLDLEFLDQQNLIATSSNDLTINFWDASTFTLKQIVSVPEIQLRLRYADWKAEHKQLLYTGGSDAIVRIYDAVTLKENGTISGWNPFFKSDQQQEGHTSPIGDMLAVPSQHLLATACISGKICLWDATTHRLRKELRGHDKGVYSLAWCDWSQMNQCLLSAGLDHEAFVWNTYVRDKIFLLRGHNHPLVGVSCLPDSPQIVTADISGMVKLWDVRNFLCVQTFNVPVGELNAFALTYSRGLTQTVKKRIICCSKRMHCYEYDEPRDQLLSDEKPCLQVLFNLTMLCFITLHLDCIKIWDARTGRLSAVYRRLSPADLTRMTLDSRERKLFVGDADGCLFTVNIKNGAKMKEFQKHHQAITTLAFWSSENAALKDERFAGLRRVVSASMGSEVNIHDEDSPEDAKSSCRYVIRQHKQAVNSIAVKENSELMASGSDDGSLVFTNLVSYRHEVMPRLSKTPIRHVLFLDPFEVLLAVDQWGCLSFYGFQDSRPKEKVLYEQQYMTESMTNKLEAFSVTAVRFSSDERLLILGDEFGNIELWSLPGVFEKAARSKTKQLSLTMLTELIMEEVTREFVKLAFKVKGAHNDGITSLELIKENRAFISSGFDCCCYIWRFEDGTRIGTLIMGGDPSWGLHFDMKQKKRDAVREALGLLEKLGERKRLLFSASLDDDESQKQFEAVKTSVLKGARALLESTKKAREKVDVLADVLGETNRLELEFFQDTDDGPDQTLLEEFQQTQLQSKLKK